MKYNPKVNEIAADLPGFARLHPYQPEETAQGALALMYHLGQYLCEIAGLAQVSLQPAAGAHGEWTGLMVIKAHHKANGEDSQRKQVIIPDSGHGTNPASAAMCGYQVVTVPSDERGGIDLEALRKVVGPQTAALMRPTLIPWGYLMNTLQKLPILCTVWVASFTTMVLMPMPF